MNTWKHLMWQYIYIVVGFLNICFETKDLNIAIWVRYSYLPSLNTKYTKNAKAFTFQFYKIGPD